MYSGDGFAVKYGFLFVLILIIGLSSPSKFGFVVLPANFQLAVERRENAHPSGPDSSFELRL